jgi:hypothetical protein
VCKKGKKKSRRTTAKFGIGERKFSHSKDVLNFGTLPCVVQYIYKHSVQNNFLEKEKQIENDLKMR